MTISQIILLVIGSLFLVAVGYCFIFGKNYLSYSKIFSPIVSLMCSIVKGFSGMFPNNGTLYMISFAMEYSMVGARKAEELWQEGTIDKEKRNEYATIYVETMLEEAGIEVTESLRNVIQGTMSFICMLLPHEIKATESELIEQFTNEETTETETVTETEVNE